MVISNGTLKQETAVVRSLRAGFRWWPFLHGRGWILRLSRLLIGREAVIFDIGGGTLIEGSLDDWMIVWTFMRRHEADAPFLRSFELLRTGDTVLDIGANLGIWSLLAARRARDVRVHAFEPVPEFAERLRAHTTLNEIDNVSIHSFACGAQAGALSFFARRSGNTGASSLRRRDASEEEIVVHVVPLDQFLSERGIERVTMIKVDVEGAELLVFRGARRLLASEAAPMVFFEVDDELCAGFGTSGREVKQFLAGCGYRIYRWSGTAFVQVPIEGTQPHEDLFALKPHHLQRAS